MTKGQNSMKMNVPRPQVRHSNRPPVRQLHTSPGSSNQRGPRASLAETPFVWSQFESTPRRCPTYLQYHIVPLPSGYLEKKLNTLLLDTFRSFDPSMDAKWTRIRRKLGEVMQLFADCAYRKMGSCWAYSITSRAKIRVFTRKLSIALHYR